MSDDLVRVPDIQSADWQAKVGLIGAVVEDLDDIDQCIITILFTRKGSLPHDPDFGSDLWQYVDGPVDAMRPKIVAEIIDAIGKLEPRAELLAVTCGLSESSDSALEIQIVRRRRGATAAPTTLVLQVTP